MLTIGEVEATIRGIELVLGLAKEAITEYKAIKDGSDPNVPAGVQSTINNPAAPYQVPTPIIKPINESTAAVSS